MDFLELARDRFSCRKLSGEPVEQEKIKKIVESALVSPTAVNFQPFKIWVVQNEELLKKVADSADYRFVSSTPVIFIIGSDKSIAWTREDGLNFADIDASIVATTMMYAIHDLGLRSTWVGHFDVEKINEAIPETSEYNLIALFPVGYPTEESKPSIRHFESKEEDELVRYL